jgi:hypothetical protein
MASFALLLTVTSIIGYIGHHDSSITLMHAVCRFLTSCCRWYPSADLRGILSIL